MIRSLYRMPDGQHRFELKPDEFGPALQDPAGLLWVDFESEPPEVCEPILRSTFDFHPLAIDDALQESHVPKVDDWGEYLYLVLDAIICNRQDGIALETVELDVFLGENYIVTSHDDPIEAVTRVWTACQRDERHSRKGPDHLLYRMVDELAAGYMQVVEEMDETVDLVEDQIFDNPTSETLARIFMLKRALLRLRQVLSPQREVLNRLARDDYRVIDAQDRVFFRDVYDHLVRLHDINESMRDLISGAMDTYLSIINNRMNDIMKTLTIITTLFMPLSFLAGFFGMNFFQPVAPFPQWTGKTAFEWMMGLMIVLPILMYLWMRRRGWM